MQTARNGDVQQDCVFTFSKNNFFDIQNNLLLSPSTHSCALYSFSEWIFLIFRVLQFESILESEVTKINSTAKMETNNGGQTREPVRLEIFNLIYIIIQLIGVTIIILMASWVFGYLGGLSWSATPNIQFNWHPLLMSIGMIYLYGNCKWILWKWLHFREFYSSGFFLFFFL